MHTENVFYSLAWFTALLDLVSPIYLTLPRTAHPAHLSASAINMPTPCLPLDFDAHQKSTFNTV